MVTRRKWIAAGTHLSAGISGLTTAWHAELVWFKGSPEPRGISRFGWAHPLKLNADIRNSSIVIRGVSSDGRFIFFECPSLSTAADISRSTGCLEIETGKVVWLLPPDRGIKRDMYWVPGTEASFSMLTYRDPDRVELCCYSVGGTEIVEMDRVRLDLKFGTKWGHCVGVGKKLVLFTSGKRIWHWVPGAKHARDCADGLDVAVAPDGQRLSILESTGCLRIVEWMSGRTLRILKGKYGDAGRWHPDSSKLLVCDLDGVTGVPFPLERIRLYELDRDEFRWGSFYHRIMLGTSSLAWVRWAPDSLANLSVAVLARAAMSRKPQ